MFDAGILQFVPRNTCDTVRGLSIAATSGTAKALELQDRLTWGVAHLMMLSGAGERRERDEILNIAPSRHSSPTLACAAQAGVTREAGVATRT